MMMQTVQLVDFEDPVDLLPGAEPFSADGGPIGFLLSHGFTGTPASMRR